jgi:hypothetical protein
MKPMKRIITLLIFSLVFLLLSPPAAVMAHSVSIPAIQDNPWGGGLVEEQPPAAPQDALAYGPDTMFWRTGTDFIGLHPGLSWIAQRNPTAVSRFQSSNVNPDGVRFYILGAAARPLRVADARVLVLSRGGSYTDDVTFALWSADMAGYGDHRVSLGSLNLESLPIGSWVSMSLSDNPHYRVIPAGETLLVAYALSGAEGGTLNAHLIYDVALTTHTTEINLPMIYYTH